MGTKKRFPQDHQPYPEATRLWPWVGLMPMPSPRHAVPAVPWHSLIRPLCHRDLLLWAPLTLASETTASTPKQSQAGTQPCQLHSNSLVKRLAPDGPLIIHPH